MQRENSPYLACNERNACFNSEHQNRYQLWSCQNMCEALTFLLDRGWSGGAMLLGKLPVPGRPTIWITVEQGLTALAVGAGGGVWKFLLSSIRSFLFLPLFGRRTDID